MINSNKWKINKLTSAIIMVSGLALVGCGDDTESVVSSVGGNAGVSTDGTFSAVNNPKGSISGLVQDTNGNPIEGATVYIANQMATTNAGGLYYFEEVKITQTVPREDGTYAQAMTVSIVPPAGYLGATVTVQPQAQVFEYSTGNGDTATSTNTVFIDGFVAEAGAAVLPALTASVGGYLRNQASEAIIAGAVLSLDVVSVNGNNQEQNIDGVTHSYATSSFSATTDASGHFSFSGLPADTLLEITASNYQVIGGATQVDTQNENGMNGLEVTAVPFISVDAVAPYVKMVAQVGDQTGSLGLLDDDFGTTLTVKFSENLDASLLDSTNSVVVRNVDANAYVTHTSSLSGDTLTINLSSAIPAGNEVHVWLLKDDLRDSSGNLLTTGTDVGFDTNSSTSTSSQYVKLALKAYKEANQNATSPSQSQLKTDETGINNLDAIQAGNNAANTAYVTFLDVDDETAGIQQLNSADDDDNSGTPDTDTRLSALLAQVAGNIGAAGATNVDSDNALVTFTSTNASYYYLNVTDAAGNNVVNAITESIKEGATFGADPDGDTRRIDPDAEGITISVLVADSVEPGYVVTITPYDDFGYAGTPNSITLVDNVAPTTILQTSYGVGNEESGRVTSLQFGDGGEQAGLANVTPGTPYYDLTPRLLGQADGTTTGTEGDVNYVRSFEALYKLNAVNPAGSANTTTTIGDQFIPEAGNIYDTTAWAAYLVGFDFSRTLGVAFSEDIALTGNAPAFTAVGSASVPSNFVVNNDVTIDDNGTAVNADLVNFDLADVYNFALSETGAVLDFTGAVQDNAGNIATETAGSPTLTNNAKVIFRDLLPPMVESATYDGRTLTVVFDKDINTDLLTADGVTMSLNGQSIDLSDADNYTWNAATDTLVAKLGDAYGTFNTATVFNLAQYNDASLADNVASDALQYAHSALDFSLVPNVNGATWDDFDSLGVLAEGYFEKPTFATTNLVGVFGETNTNSALGSSTITITYEFKHGISLDAVDGADNVMDSNEIQSIFAWSGGTINAAGNNLSITPLANGGSRLTFLLSLSAPTVVGQTLDADFDGDAVFNGDADDRKSLYDGVGYPATRITF